MFMCELDSHPRAQLKCCFISNRPQEFSVRMQTYKNLDGKAPEEIYPVSRI